MARVGERNTRRDADSGRLRRCGDAVGGLERFGSLGLEQNESSQAGGSRGLFKVDGQGFLSGIHRLISSRFLTLPIPAQIS